MYFIVESSRNWKRFQSLYICAAIVSVGKERQFQPGIRRGEACDFHAGSFSRQQFGLYVLAGQIQVYPGQVRVCIGQQVFSARCDPAEIQIGRKVVIDSVIIRISADQIHAVEALKGAEHAYDEQQAVQTLSAGDLFYLVKKQAGGIRQKRDCNTHEPPGELNTGDGILDQRKTGKSIPWKIIGSHPQCHGTEAQGKEQFLFFERFPTPAAGQYEKSQQQDDEHGDSRRFRDSSGQSPEGIGGVSVGSRAKGEKFMDAQPVALNAVSLFIAKYFQRISRIIQKRQQEAKIEK